MATTNVLLRLPPELHEAIVQQVAGMNRARVPGDPKYTVTGYVVGVLSAVFDPPEDISGPTLRHKLRRDIKRKLVRGPQLKLRGAS